MTYRFRSTQPKLTGTIVKERIRCGKPGCHCAKGVLHRWYYCLRWREDGKLKREYIPKDRVKKIKDRIRYAKAKDIQERITSRDYLSLVRQLYSLL